MLLSASRLASPSPNWNRPYVTGFALQIYNRAVIGVGAGYPQMCEGTRRAIPNYAAIGLSNFKEAEPIGP
jgi:hypothetical protein